MKLNFVFKIIYVLFIFSSFRGYSQTESANSCKEIYGKWKTYYIQMPFGIDPEGKSEIWIFNEDGTLIKDGEKTFYVLNDECSALYVGERKIFYSVTIHEGNLYIVKTIFPHESLVLRFKKIN